MQVGGSGRVELQGAGQGVEDLIGRMLVASLLQPQVVVGADAGQHRELLAAQAGDLCPAARDQPDVLGPDQVAPRPQVVPSALALSMDRGYSPDRRGEWSRYSQDQQGLPR